MFLFYREWHVMCQAGDQVRSGCKCKKEPYSNGRQTQMQGVIQYVVKQAKSKTRANCDNEGKAVIKVEVYKLGQESWT